MTKKSEKTGNRENPGAIRAPLTGVSLSAVFSDCYDYERRALRLPGGVEAEFCYVDGLVSGQDMGQLVLRPLTDPLRFGAVTDPEEAVGLIMSGLAYGYSVKKRQKLDDVVSDLLSGYCAVVFGQIGTAVTFEARTPDKRAISEPKEEKPLKGGKDVFVELIKTNTMLVRRRLREPGLKLRELTVGRRTRTTVTVVYIEGLTDPALVEEMTSRLRRIDVDGAVSAGNVEPYLCDRRNSVFPQLLRTERPDRFVTNLLEGRVGLLIDGLPMGLLAPAPLIQFLKMPEDSAYHYIISSLLTVMRVLCLFLVLLLPAVYVAVAMYHQEMIPVRLMETMIQSKQAVPFPTAAETVGMLLAFEILQEAGLRLPDTVGQTVSVIGALIVGQSAVEAKVISPIVVIVVALSGIAGYTVPNTDLSSALRVWRLLFVLSAACGGFFAMMALFCLLVYRLCSLTSFGTPYLSPFSGGSWRSVLRALFRVPPFREKLRWEDVRPVDRRRQR